MWELVEGWLLAVAIVAAVVAIYSLSKPEGEDANRAQACPCECVE